MDLSDNEKVRDVTGNGCIITLAVGLGLLFLAFFAGLAWHVFVWVLSWG